MTSASKGFISLGDKGNLKSLAWKKFWPSRESEEAIFSVGGGDSHKLCPKHEHCSWLTCHLDYGGYHWLVCNTVWRNTSDLLEALSLLNLASIIVSVSEGRMSIQGLYFAALWQLIFGLEKKYNEPIEHY